MPPEGLVLAWATFVGACVGSFLNVVVARLPDGESVVAPRSRCPRCRTPIAWYDNIPLLSFALLRARCRHCAAPIAWRYPLVELLMAVLSAALVIQFGLSWELLRWWPLFAAFLAIVFLDIDHWWVPDVITFPAMIWGGACSFLPGAPGLRQAALGLLPALGLFALAWVFERLTGREGMGRGDIKLLAVIGIAAGPIAAFWVLMLASLQGAVIGVVVILTGGHRGRDDAQAATTAAPPSPSPPSASPTSGEVAPATGSTSHPHAPLDATRTPTSAAAPGASPLPSDAAPAAATPDPDDPDLPYSDDVWVPPRHAFPFGPILVLATFEVVLLPGPLGELLARTGLPLSLS